MRRIYLHGWGRIARPDYEWLIGRLAGLCTDIVVNINDGNAKDGAGNRRGWHTFGNRSPAEWNALFERLRAAGLRVHVMTWCKPDPAWYRPMCEFLPKLDLHAGETVLFDLEGPWATHFPSGVRRWQRGAARTKAAEHIAAAMTGAGLVWGITDVPMVAWGKVKPIARLAGYLMPQAHTFGYREGKKHHRFKRAGWLERWTHRKWSKRLGPGQRLILHIGDYDTRTYRQTPEALRISLDTVEALGYDEVAAWTGAHGPKHRPIWRALKEANHEPVVAAAQGFWARIREGLS